MKKILIVITTEFVSYGGLTTVMMNYYKALNKKGLLIDFASTNHPSKSDLSFSYLIDNNSKYYCLGHRKKNVFQYLRNLRILLKKNHYDVVHVNGNSATMLLELFVAKSCKVPVRIAHGHTTQSNHPIIHQILKRFLNLFYTHAIAVSQQTGEWLYGKNFIVLNNAIDVNKFCYNAKVRNNIRERYGWNNFTIIGNVGKLYAAKNQKFLIEIFSYYHKQNKNSKLVLVGGGDLEHDLKQFSKEKQIEKDVIFLGMCNNIQELIQGFDIFVFPSLYEGLGLALIEAQASGLPCIASDTVPKETKVTNNIKYCSLNRSPQSWAEEILNVKLEDREIHTKDIQDSIKKYGYDIATEATKLEKIYRT